MCRWPKLVSSELLTPSPWLDAPVGATVSSPQACPLVERRKRGGFGADRHVGGSFVVLDVPCWSIVLVRETAD